MQAAIDIAAAVMGEKRELTDDERWAVEMVLDAAKEWAEGTMRLYAFEQTVTLPAWMPDGKSRYDSTGYPRWLACWVTPKSDPRRAHLVAAIDALVALQDGQRTTRGFFSHEELRHTNTSVRGQQP